MSQDADLQKLMLIMRVLIMFVGCFKNTSFHHLLRGDEPGHKMPVETGQRLTMTGTVPPTGPSGAQWLYGADTSNPLVFCAYNNDPNYGA